MIPLHLFFVFKIVLNLCKLDWYYRLHLGFANDLIGMKVCNVNGLAFEERGHEPCADGFKDITMPNLIQFLGCAEMQTLHA